MSRLRIAMYLLACLFVAGIGLGVAAYCRLADEPEALLSVLPARGEISLDNVRHVATRDGVREWSLDAASAQYIKEDNKTLFKEVSATFFLKNSKAVRISGRDGMLSNDSSNIEVHGDVVVENGPYRLNTDKLQYEHASRTISSDTPVTIKGEGIEITGNRLAFDIQKELVVVSGRVKALFEPQKQAAVGKRTARG